jgi:hypothetical protein
MIISISKAFGASLQLSTAATIDPFGKGEAVKQGIGYRVARFFLLKHTKTGKKYTK